MRQNVTSFYERSQSAESASQANMDKFYDTNAPGITLNDTCLLRWWKEHERFPALFDPDRVSLPNSPALKHGGIDTHIDLIVLGRCPQNTGITGQVSLRQRRHHTAGARTCDTEANLIADGERVANPGVLNEVLYVAGGLHDDVWAKAAHLESPWWIQFPQPVKGGRCQQMDGSTVEEGAFWQSKVGDSLAEVESFHIRPVLFSIRRPGIGRRRLNNLFLAAFGCIQGHLAVKRLGENLVDIALFIGEYRTIRQRDPHSRQRHTGVGGDDKSSAEVEQMR